MTAPAHPHRAIAQAATTANEHLRQLCLQIATPIPNLPQPAKTCQSAPLAAGAQNEPRLPLTPSSPPPLPPPTRPSAPNEPTNPAEARQILPNPATLSTQDSALSTDLSPRQRYAARLLIAGHTLTAAAALLNVNRHTVAGWRKLPAFHAELDRLLNQLTPAV
ncbi:MAG TPA: hypothetical protein VH475_17660 [Tepidisphaeraceae bacterium]